MGEHCRVKNKGVYRYGRWVIGVRFDRAGRRLIRLGVDVKPTIGRIEKVRFIVNA